MFMALYDIIIYSINGRLIIFNLKNQMTIERLTKDI